MSVRDRIAAAPMASVDAGRGVHPRPGTAVAPQIVVPVATVEAGPAGVPSGFPHTPEGAVGQLAAIEQTVLESMSLPVAREVHRAWVLPGGPAFEEWELTRNVESFLAAGRQGGQAKDVTTLVTATPAAALVKGTDGPDWVVACVLLDVQVAIRTEARMGYGLLLPDAVDSTSRWLIAAGTPPAPAPSAWPGSVGRGRGGLADLDRGGGVSDDPVESVRELGSTAAQIVTDAWTAAWLSVWNAGLWVLRLVLSWMDAWLTPDLSADGPGHDLYQVTFWMAGVLVVIMLVVQIGIAAGRRDGKGLARAGIGLAQFAVVDGGWIGYTVAVTAAVGGLTRAVMESLMGVTSWNSWQPWTSRSTPSRSPTPASRPCWA